MGIRDVLTYLWRSPTVMTWGNVFVRVLGLGMLLPLVLNKFSVQDVVIWQLFTTVIMLQILIDMGFAPTFARIIAYCMGGVGIRELAHVQGGGAAHDSPDWDAIGKIMLVMQRVYKWLVVFSFVFTATIGSWAVSGSIAESSVPDRSWMAWCVIVIVGAWQLYGNRYTAFLQGVNKIAIWQRWQMFFSLLSAISASVVLLLGADILILIVVYQIWPAINVFVNIRMKRKQLREQSTVTADEFDHIVRVVWPSVWRSGIGVVMSTGVVQVSGIVYANLGEAAEVSAYLLGLQIIRVISSFSQAPFYSKIPTFSKYYAQADLPRLLDLAKYSMRLSYVVYVFGFVSAGFCADWVLNMVGSSVAFPSMLLWSVLGLAMFLERFGAMHIQLYSSSNKIIWHTANGVSGIIMILLSVTLYPVFEVLAFPIAIFLSYLCFYCWYTAIHSYKEFGQNFFDFEKSVSLPAFSVLLLSVVVMMNE